jgi:hypothetical protein
VTGGGLRHRDLIITLAARHKLPAVYVERHFVAAGGLISYGPDYIDQYRRAFGYVGRILKGENPAELPVQAPTKYELVPRRRGDRMNRRDRWFLRVRPQAARLHHALEAWRRPSLPPRGGLDRARRSSVTSLSLLVIFPRTALAGRGRNVLAQ